MTKNRIETVLNDEIKVMEALEQHAKENIDTIANKCGFSRQKVWRIIKDLEQRKIIWGYTAITDEQAKNLKHFILLLKRTTTPFDADTRKEIIADKLDSHISGGKIEDVYLTHGIYDFVITFHAPTLVSAKQFVYQLFRRHNIQIQEYSIIETLVPVRKYGFKNPRIKELIDYI